MASGSVGRSPQDGGVPVVVADGEVGVVLAAGDEEHVDRDRLLQAQLPQRLRHAEEPVGLVGRVRGDEDPGLHPPLPEGGDAEAEDLGGHPRGEVRRRRRLLDPELPDLEAEEAVRVGHGVHAEEMELHHPARDRHHPRLLGPQALHREPADLPLLPQCRDELVQDVLVGVADPRMKRRRRGF